MPKARICIESLITISKWFPVVVTATIFSWGWYAYTFQVVIFSMQSLIQKLICSVIFHILYILSTFSYFQTIFAPLGKIPNKFFLSPEISEDLIKADNEQAREEILFNIVKRNDLPVACRSYSGGIRYCEKCQLIKPDRCHHCSICRKCVLRMDHHCPWINNCVSFTNYKFFVLFLGYTFLLCLFVSATTLPYFLKYWSLSTMPSTSSYHPQANISATPYDPSQDQPQTNPSDSNYYGLTSAASASIATKFHILFLTFVSSMISLALLLLFCYHSHLILHNRSTLESFRPPLMTYGPDKNAFNLGKCENFAKLFGRSKLLWFLPVYTTEGTGLFYDQRPQIGAGDEEARQELLNPQNVNVNTRPNHDTEV